MSSSFSSVRRPGVFPVTPRFMLRRNLWQQVKLEDVKEDINKDRTADWPPNKTQACNDWVSHRMHAQDRENIDVNDDGDDAIRLSPNVAKKIYHAQRGQVQRPSSKGKSRPSAFNVEGFDIEG